MANFIDIARAVFAQEEIISGFKGNAAEAREQANAAKIAAYSEIISGLSGITLTGKGKLPAADSKALKDTLTEAGVSPACVKRYVENSTAALRVFDFPSQSTPELVEEILASENIDSENKLKKACFQQREVSDVQAFAEKLIGKFATRYSPSGVEVTTKDFKPSKLSDEEIDASLQELEEAISVLRAARNAAAMAGSDAAAEAEAENAAVRAFVEAAE